MAVALASSVEGWGEITARVSGDVVLLGIGVLDEVVVGVRVAVAVSVDVATGEAVAVGVALVVSVGNGDAGALGVEVLIAVGAAVAVAAASSGIVPAVTGGSKVLGCGATTFRTQTPSLVAAKS